VKQFGLSSGIEQIVRSTTLVEFSSAVSRRPQAVADMAQAVTYLADAARRVAHFDIVDRRLAAFLLFEASTHDREPVHTGRRPWFPLVAAQHLFGLINYDLDQPALLDAGANHSLEYYIADYNEQVERKERLTRIDPLSSWTLRQIIASGESELNSVRQALQPGKGRMSDVADALLVEVERMLESVDVDELVSRIADWNARSIAAVQQRRAPHLERTELGESVRVPVLQQSGTHHRDYERLLDRRVIVFTSSDSSQIIEYNTRRIRVLAPVLSRIVLSRVSTSNADALPTLVRLGVTDARAINPRRVTIDDNPGFSWDLELTFPATRQTHTRVLEWVSITNLPAEWRSPAGSHAMWMSTAYETERAEMLVTFDSADMPNEVEAFADVDVDDIGQRRYPVDHVESGVLASSGPAVSRAWDRLRPGRAYGLTAIWPR
jgi:hypothetical protein